MIGIDIVEVSRFAEMKLFDAFLEKVFSEEEIAHIRAGNSFERAAGLWAAKEAVAKALGSGFSGLNPRAVRIFHDERGAPHASAGGRKFAISISHEKSVAAAVALLTGEEEGNV